MGSALQSSAVIDVAECGLGLKPIFSAIILLILLLPCLIHGVKRIEKITEIIIPLTTTIYIIMCFCVIFMNFSRLSSVISDILSSAFQPISIASGIIPVAVREGFSRGILSNEAGIGSSSMAHIRGGRRSPHVAGLFGIVVHDTITFVIVPCHFHMVDIERFKTDLVIEIDRRVAPGLRMQVNIRIGFNFREKLHGFDDY